MVARACGSMPAVGSSRNTSARRPTSASASESRCRCPPERRRTRVPRDVAEADEVEQPLGVVGVVVERGEESERLERAHARVQAALLEHHADPRTGGSRRRATGRGRGRARRRRRRGGSPRGSRPWSSCPRRSVRAGRTPRRRDREGDPVDRRRGAVALLERGDLDRVRRRVHRCGSLATPAWAGGFDA